MTKQLEAGTRSVVGLKSAIVGTLVLVAGGAFLVAHWLLAPAPALVPLSPTRVPSQSSPTAALPRELERPESQSTLDRSTPTTSSKADLLITDTVGSTPAFDLGSFDAARTDRDHLRAGNRSWLDSQRLLEGQSERDMVADLQKISESLRDEQSTEHPFLRDLVRQVEASRGR